MNVLVFHDLGNEHYVSAIEAMLGAQGCVMRVLRIRDVFDQARYRNPLHAFDGISHVVFLYDGVGNEMAAHTFLAGYALGRGLRVIIVEFDAHMDLPVNCAHLGIVLRPEELEDYLAAEEIRYREEERHTHARETLLNRGISVFPENFSIIVAAGDSESARLFIDAGYDPDMKDARGNPLLTIAVRSQFPEIVGILLEAGADVNRLSGDRGYSPLMDAAQKGDLAIVEILLSHGADPNIRSRDGQTALILSAGRGDVPMCRALVKRGADPNVSDKLGMSASGYAKLFGNGELMELFNPGSS